jgi:peptidoglycan hydrolase-like amidase
MKETFLVRTQLFNKAVPVALSMLFLASTVPSVSASAKAPIHHLYAKSTAATGCSPYPPMLNPVRVGLAVRAPLVRFALWAPGYVFVNGQPIFDVKPGTVYSISHGRITELATGRNVALPMDQRSYVSAPPDFRVWTGNRWYRGCLELISFGNRVSVINLLELEDYLLGVVPSEMPANWCMEALKAQAVAARSYAWAHQGNSSKWRTEGFDVVPDVRDQAYNGMAREAPATFLAVQKTRGIILKDSGRIKPGFYRAWVGDDIYENLNIRKSAVPTTTLEKLTGVKGIVGVTVKQWDASGNARDIQVMGAKKSQEVYGVELARRLGFSTAGILDVREDGPSWMFTYRGPGNGARGLSQHGANMLASKGWRFDQILTQYYQDPDGKLRLDVIDTYKQPMFHERMRPKDEPVATDNTEKTEKSERSERSEEE